jgi:hypothetical protein
MVVKAVQIKNINKDGQPRYYVVDINTRKIVLAGSKHTGYRTAQGAYNAARHMFGWSVKIFDPEIDVVTWWLTTHKYVMDTISAYAHHIQVGDFTPYEHIDVELVRQILEFFDLDVDIPINRILFAWRSSAK